MGVGPIIKSQIVKHEEWPSSEEEIKVMFKKIKKMVIEYHMADTHPELLDELIKKLKAENFKLETKVLFKDIGFLYAIRISS